MAETAVSGTESALENQRFGGLQIRVSALCALIALLAMPYLVLLTILFFTGTTIIGSQTGANAACGALYPARMRSSGNGWALGIGRLGGIAAAPLGGFLLARGLPAPQIFLSACFFALVAATALLVLRGRPSTPLADPRFPAGLA
jgi:MFS family permease